MKSFSQLKKDLAVGVVVETVLNRYKPEKNGQKRCIAKVQTNAIGFEIPEEERRPDFRGNIQVISWLWWDKAGCYEYEDDTFKVYHHENGDRVLDFVYKILEGGAK